MTSVGDDCVEGEVTDAPLPADCGPWRLAWMVVLHHQRETVPGEVWAYMLLTHHHTHTALHAGEQDGSKKTTLLFNIAA